MVEKNSKDCSPMLSEKELAARLHVSLQHVGRLRKLGKLPWNKIGRSPRFSWESVMSATEQQGGSHA